MTTQSQLDAVRWHLNSGGYNGRLAGHALRMLNEVVELCVAAGADAVEIQHRVNQELAKASSRGEFDRSFSTAEVRKELVDVQILGDILAHHTGGVSTDAERRRKMSILYERSWEVDGDGVLWRPGSNT